MNELAQEAAKLAATASDRYRETMAKQLNKTMDTVLEKLLPSAATNRILPERIFVEYFLPYFSGEKEIDEENKVIGEWIGIAGYPGSEVNIVADDDHKKVLYTVPAIIETGHIDPVRKGRSMSAVVYNTQLRSDFPGQADSFAIKATEEIFHEQVKPRLNMANNQRWMQIFERYNSRQSNPNKEGHTSSPSSPNVKMTDDVIYDDYS